MKRLLLVAAVIASALAKPEVYKEKEDFQFSRSSSDEGSKSGYYGAQRGNMGGNYERAHNMDGLAQHQMSGLVKQVEGELGDGSQMRTGNVFSSANSRGIYGSGHYDLSNLEGRNFQEGVSLDNSQSASSSLSSAYRHSSSGSTNGYRNNYENSRNNEFQAGRHADQLLQASNLQESNSEGRAHDYDRQSASQSAGYYSQSRYRGQTVYDNTNTNTHSADYGSNIHNRLITATPVRVVVRPGTRVVIPVAYDVSQNSVSSYDKSSLNSEAEVLGTNDQQTNYQKYNTPKHYESSYSYRKQWEKSDTKPEGTPLAIPTVNNIPSNSELFEDSQVNVNDRRYDTTRAGSQRAHSQSNIYQGYDANAASTSQSRHQSNYNSQSQRSLGYNTQSQGSSDYNTQSQRSSDYNAQSQRLASGAKINSNTNGIYDLGSSADLNLVNENTNSKPKSYQSSYSYHKSWERQGDPYVIKPSSGTYDGQTSQKLTSASAIQGGYSSQRYGSQYQQSHHSHTGSNALYGDCDENSHVRAARSYNSEPNEYWNNQQSQNIYEGQQAQNIYEGQQAQNIWQNSEDVGQQAQNTWQNFEDLGQQVEQKWGNQENLQQQAQNKYENLEDLGQQTQNTWNNLDDFGQQTQKDLGQQAQDTWSNFDYKPQGNDGQQIQSNWNNINELSQQAQSTSTIDFQNLSEKSENNGPSEQQLETIDFINQHKPQSQINAESHPQIQNVWDKIDGLDFYQNTNDNMENTNKNSMNIDNSKPNHANWQPKSEKEEKSHDFSFDNMQFVHINGDSKNNEPFSMQSNTDDTQQAVDSFNLGSHYTHGYGQIESQNNLYSQYGLHQYNNWNANTNYQPGTYSNQPFVSYSSSPDSNTQLNTQGASSLQTLWGKLDNIEKTSLNGDMNTSYVSHKFQSSQNSTQNTEQAHTYSFMNNFGSSYSYHHNQFNSQTGDLPTLLFNLDKTTTSESPLQNDNIKPIDIGRGDIGPEDSFPDEKQTHKPNSDDNEYPTINKSYKTPEEIDALSLVKENNQSISLTNNNDASQITKDNNNPQSNNDGSDNTLSVVSLLQQQQEKIHYGEILQMKNDTTITSSTTQKAISIADIIKYNSSISESVKNSYNNTIELTDQAFNEAQKDKTEVQLQNEIFPQNQDQQFKDFGQQNENLSQQNMEQQFENIGQINEKLYPQNQEQEQQFNNFGQQNENLSQQNMEQQFENNGQLNENINPLSQEQQYKDFGQQNENTSQQNMEQQFESIGQLNENLYTQNQEQQFKDIRQQNDQEHQFKELGQQSENTNQAIWRHQSEDLGQQVQTSWEPSEDLQQHTQKSDNMQITTNDELNKEHDSKEPLNPEINQNEEKITEVEVISPPEPVTEKPGFWKSVGNKFESAKNKVTSWFRS